MRFFKKIVPVMALLLALAGLSACQTAKGVKYSPETAASRNHAPSYVGYHDVAITKPGVMDYGFQQDGMSPGEMVRVQFHPHKALEVKVWSGPASVAFVKDVNGIRDALVLEMRSNILHNTLADVLGVASLRHQGGYKHHPNSEGMTGLTHGWTEEYIFVNRHDLITPVKKLGRMLHVFDNKYSNDSSTPVIIASQGDDGLWNIEGKIYHWADWWIIENKDLFSKADEPN